MITNLNNFVNESLGSTLALPANGLGGSRATSLSVAHFALQNTKFGSEKGKVQKPARIPPQTPPAGGKKAEAGQFHFPRKIVCPAESKLVFRIFGKKSSNINQKTPHLMQRRPWALFASDAEGEGFEPSVPFGTHAFQACALDHYANPPCK